jgi:hypothetical protein
VSQSESEWQSASQDGKHTPEVALEPPESDPASPAGAASEASKLASADASARPGMPDGPVRGVLSEHPLTLARDDAKSRETKAPAKPLQKLMKRLPAGFKDDGTTARSSMLRKMPSSVHSRRRHVPTPATPPHQRRHETYSRPRRSIFGW